LRKIVITGLGCVTPVGIGAERLWSAVVAGESGIDLVSTFDPAGCGSQVAGEVHDFRPEDFLARRDVQSFARFLHFGVAAARMAWDDAGNPSDSIDRDRIGVFLGSAVGAINRTVSDGATFAEKGLSRVHPMFPLQYPGSLPSEVAIALGLHGPAYAISTACTASADAIGLAFGQVASGMLDAALVGGSEAAIFPLLYASFDRMGALSKLNDPPSRASRPFSRERNGFVLSEGAGVLLIEAEEIARARGARIYAELAGFGATCDAHHHLAPEPEGEQGARAIRIALKQAGLSATDVDYINAHGTSTQKNDSTETLIIKKVFGEHAYRIPVSSSKSMLGHLIGASAAVELIISALALHHGVVPPTINVTDPDPACDLDYVTEGARPMALKAVVSNSFGFGSRNAALVLRAAPSSEADS
jgi:3-oxoacyl-[acyl-carrier-protein] synthase II